jgi:hypothetical protein
MDEDKLASLMLKAAVRRALATDNPSDEETRASLLDLLADRLEWVSEYGLGEKIQKIWNPDYQPPRPPPPRVSATVEPGVCYGPPEPAWSVGLTPTFQKSIGRNRCSAMLPW